MAKKGGEYEREFAKELSLWFSKGKSSDIFWRTPGSGGRAKFRGRQGHTTANQHGDLMATDPSGIQLLNLLVLELKRGYSDQTIQDLLDRPKKYKKGKLAQNFFLEWLDQVSESAQQAGTPFWLLIWRRDYAEPLLIFPEELLPVFDNVRLNPLLLVCPDQHPTVYVTHIMNFWELDPLELVAELQSLNTVHKKMKKK